MTRILPLLVIVLGASRPATAQTSTDTLRLPQLRLEALTTDPRTEQLQLLAMQSALRLKTIAADLRPTLSLYGTGQYQSDVASIPVNLPGVTVPVPPHDTYDARLSAQQRIFDPTISSRRAVERAQTAESQARVRTALYTISESVNGAYFIALRSQSQIAELETTIVDLNAQIVVADARVKAGTALPSESNTLRAELLRRMQTVAEQVAVRRAAVAVIADLVGRPIDVSAPLSIPDLEAAVATLRDTTELRNRPEYAQFERTLDVLRRTEDARAAQDKPRVSAFGSLGYGRPGLKFLSDKFDSYWLTGVRFQWTPFNWGTSGRDRQLTALQRNIVSSEEKAFTASLRRAVQTDLASIDRLQAASSQDEEIVALREGILAEARARYAESVITSAEFVDRQTDVLAARLTRATHRVELAQARAHLLTTYGIEVR